MINKFVTIILKLFAFTILWLLGYGIDGMLSFLLPYYTELRPVIFSNWFMFTIGALFVLGANNFYHLEEYFNAKPEKNNNTEL